VTEVPSATKYFTTSEVAKLLGVTAPTVINWVDQGRMEAFRTPGGHRRIPLISLVRFADECGKGLPGISREGLNLKAKVTRVLVVDCEVDFAEMVAEFLNLQEGVVAQCALEPVEVGFQLGTYGPDVVLCGVDVPGVTPQAVADMLHHKDCRIILLTSLRTVHDESLGMELGVESVVEKSIKLDALLRLIHP
jgi:excisionase family DNA binding protein